MEFDKWAVGLIAYTPPDSEIRRKHIENIIRVKMGSKIPRGENKKVDTFRDDVNVMRTKTDGDKNKLLRKIKGLKK